MLIKHFKDSKLRHKYFLIEKLKVINKYLFITFLCNPNNTTTSMFLPTKNLLFKNSSLLCKTKLNNRCINTNRSRGVNRYYALSRLVLKNLMQEGLVPGFKKAVW